MVDEVTTALVEEFEYFPTYVDITKYYPSSWSWWVLSFIALFSFAIGLKVYHFVVKLWS